jgi:hypothetical protein
MSKTIRVRDEDAERIETISQKTGLNKPESAHFLFCIGYRSLEHDNQCLDCLERSIDTAIERYIEAMYSDLDREDIAQPMLSQTTFDSAEPLLVASIQGPYSADDLRPETETSDDTETEA